MKRQSSIRIASVILLTMALGLSGCAKPLGSPGSNEFPQPSFVEVPASSNPGLLSDLLPLPLSVSFNGTPIPRDRTIWFSGILNYGGPETAPVTFHIEQSSIEFTANGTTYTVPVPNGTVVLSPTVRVASTLYDPVSKSWITTAPFTGKPVFFSGISWKAPVDLPGGIKPVVWRGRFTTDTPGASFKWKWAAAVYRAMSDNPDSLGVKPVDDNKLSLFLNSDHAGTPEFYKTLVTGGAMGGGGSNYTGGYSGDLTVVPAPASSGSLNGSAKIDGDKGGSLTVGRFTVQVPPGAYKGDATISIYVPDQAILRCSLNIFPATSNNFVVPVLLTSDYSGATVANAGALVHVWFDESAGVWREVPGSTSDTVGEKVRAPLGHFSEYGVMEEGRAGW